MNFGNLTQEELVALTARVTVVEARKKIVDIINDLGGVKATELCSRPEVALMNIYDENMDPHYAKTGEDRISIPALLGEMVKDGLIGEIEYSLPTSDWRLRSIYVPIGTKVSILPRETSTEYFAQEIFRFFLNKAQGKLDQAAKDVQFVEIKDLQWNNNKLEIYTNRPGVLIGKRGQQIEALTAWLNVNVTVKEVDWS